MQDKKDVPWLVINSFGMVIREMTSKSTCDALFAEMLHCFRVSYCIIHQNQYKVTSTCTVLKWPNEVQCQCAQKGVLYY